MTIKPLDSIKDITTYYKLLYIICKTYRERGAWKRHLNCQKVKEYRKKHPKFLSY